MDADVRLAVVPGGLGAPQASRVLPFGKVAPLKRVSASRPPCVAWRRFKRPVVAAFIGAAIGVGTALLATLRAEGALFAGRLQSPDAKEAFAACFQKRRPDFSQFS